MGASLPITPRLQLAARPLVVADEASGRQRPLTMREQEAPTLAFDLIYGRFMKHMRSTMTRLVRADDPTRTESAARLTVVTLMGQLTVFPVARAGVMRHLGWRRMGPTHLAQAQAIVRENLHQRCSAMPQGAPVAVIPSLHSRP